MFDEHGELRHRVESQKRGAQGADDELNDAFFFEDAKEDLPMEDAPPVDVNKSTDLIVYHANLHRFFQATIP